MSEKEVRAELFTAIEELTEIVPEMRAGQLIAAIDEVSTDIHGRGLWEASDAELLEAAWKFRKNYDAATARSAQQGT